MTIIITTDTRNWFKYFAFPLIHHYLQDKREQQGAAQGEAYEKMIEDENFLPSNEEVKLRPLLFSENFLFQKVQADLQWCPTVSWLLGLSVFTAVLNEMMWVLEQYSCLLVVDFSYRAM